LKKWHYQFPSPHRAGEDGIVCVSEELNAQMILDSYEQGIFPWPQQGEELIPWFSPQERGILHYDNIHLSTSFKKFLKKCPYDIKVNESMSQVVDFCCSQRPQETWITPLMKKAVMELFDLGAAYCISVFHRGHLVGGLYGLKIGTFVSGESMFYLSANASKVALWSLMQMLKARGIYWIDTQMVTPIVGQFGGKLVSRREFHELLKKVQWDQRIELT
jgi:leucyl/phenylalanyl-tRNA--protein transferase